KKQTRGGIWERWASERKWANMKDGTNFSVFAGEMPSFCLHCHPGARRDPGIACDADSSGFRLSPE
ncbi:MAG: hypothetical protein FWG73_08580, partial [Planctomycetaceae bacterium]|nr:hypothetical protein [Planctomycetaceae bacterium]